MNEKLKSTLQLHWREPRRFFGWLTLFSLAALVVEFLVHQSWSHTGHGETLLRAALASAAVSLAAFALGFVCFVFAWIPPVRRLLAWLLQRRWFVLACLITLVALFYAEENWRGKRAWDHYRHAWEAKGEHFDFASVIPPPVPDDQNFALTPIVASTYLAELDGHGHRLNPGNTNVVDRLNISSYRANDSGDSNLVVGAWQKATITDLKPWQNYYRHPKPGGKDPAAAANIFPTSPQPQTPAADVLLALSKYDAPLEELRAAAKLPYSRYPLFYDQEKPFDIVLPHLSKIKGVVQSLNLRIIAELQNHEPEKALADLKLALRWNDSVRNEPFLITHLVRIAAQTILVQSIWEGLAAHSWSDAQLAELQTALAPLDFLAEFQASMRGERAGSIATIDLVMRKRDFQFLNDLEAVQEMSKTKDTLSEEAEKLLALTIYFSMPEGWFLETKMIYADTFQRWLFPMLDVASHTAVPSKIKQLNQNASDLPAKSSIRHFMVGIMFFAFDRTASKSARAQGQLDLLRTALALERHRLAHGEYPTTLDALAPQFLAQVPHDLINGQPLHYRREASGQFTLYSVGWNETDDGGEVVLKEKSRTVDTDQGDWVWRYPATTK